ncbi:MAG TPA: hypothetical protein VIO94_04575 [Phenylobacterium sp.]
MKSARSNPAFDHGAALRVPPPHDARSWGKLWQWLGEDGQALEEPGAVRVSTPDGTAIAHPGDWIVLSVSGRFYVAHGRRTLDA